MWNLKNWLLTNISASVSKIPQCVKSCNSGYRELEWKLLREKKCGSVTKWVKNGTLFTVATIWSSTRISNPKTV